jgi:hypothetical protein
MLYVPPRLLVAQVVSLVLPNRLAQVLVLADDMHASHGRQHIDALGLLT